MSEMTDRVNRMIRIVREHEFTANSVDETKALAAALSTYLSPGDIVLLEGDLGAGKTQFTQGLAEAMGVTEQVTSPSYNIMIEYEGDVMPLYHFDLYRLDSAEELEDVAFYDTIESDGVSVVEWPNKFPDSMPEDYLHIELIPVSETAREVKAFANGSRYAGILASWTEALRRS